MSTPIKILLTLLGAAYIISPFDVVHDLFPFWGQLDDLIVLLAVLYYFWGINLTRLLWQKFKGPSIEDKAGPGSSDFKAGGSRTEDKSDPYEILGLKPGAGLEEIRAAYREASQKYHPDKVSHLGPEFQELAEKRFRQIQQAYETLRARVG